MFNDEYILEEILSETKTSISHIETIPSPEYFEFDKLPVIKRIQIIGKKLKVTPNHPDTKWLGIVNDLSRILGLEENWDSYGAKQVDIEIVIFALELANSLFHKETPVPNIFAVPNGGIQFDWNTQVIDLEIEITPNKRILVLYENVSEGIDEEEDFTNNLDELRGIIFNLSPKN